MVKQAPRHSPVQKLVRIEGCGSFGNFESSRCLIKEWGSGSCSREDDGVGQQLIYFLLQADRGALHD
ncbi:hypothetical protein TIFTF001_033787 [Ficus carica]|uniref:Uncharacterized protein n=1 Tax=Ficus carica TaxID=3494 RepID=A0AA88DZ64_FICCA|nr:hypothetical protein TIFTF001_033787 [Ficus carica]